MRILFLLLTCTAPISILVAATEARAVVRLEKDGAQISPYVYGQFIEHLGRCIRDGIWAEKLRDRKFFLPFDRSPWKIVQPENIDFAVVRETAGAYAGDHCVSLVLKESSAEPCGIRQGDIGVLGGKEYVGYVVLAQPQGNPVPVELRLSWPDNATGIQLAVIRDIGRAYRKYHFRFRGDVTTDAASLSLTVNQPGEVWVGCVSMMPADNLKGMRRDTLNLIRELRPPITRWPGGNFVSGYQWKDGIGPRDRRPPRWERAWNEVEDNDFGLDEFMTFCEEVQTEPYIAVNAGLGNVADAADQVEYATGSAQTWWGAARGRNGHPQPYPVVWWGIGNEMYGDWQLGNVPVAQYATRHRAFAASMKAVNPNIKIVAVGAPGAWNDGFVSAAAGEFDLLSGHHYTERRLSFPFTSDDLNRFRQGFTTYSGKVAEGVRHLVGDFRRRRQEDASLQEARLAIDEWGIVRDWNQTADGPGAGAFEHYYTLGDAVAAARALNEILRSADVVAMANWAQTVNVLGAIKTSRNGIALDPVGHVLRLYRQQLNGRLLPVELSYSAVLDVVASWDAETRSVSVALVNFSPEDEVSMVLDLQGAREPGRLRVWQIHGDTLDASNIPGREEDVFTRTPSRSYPMEEAVALPPHSVTVIRIDRVRPG